MIDWFSSELENRNERNTGKPVIATRRISPENGEGKEKVEREEGQVDEEDEFFFSTGDNNNTY